MNSDNAFLIGAAHSICQDYATSNNDHDGSYVIVSDGCSTSEATDIGARLLVQAAKQLMASRTDVDVHTMHLEAARIALEWATQMELPSQSVDATLLTAQVHDGGLIIAASGDGDFVLESHLGTIELYSISFPDGFPLYPSYEHQPDRLNAWQTNATQLKEVRHSRSMEGGPFELVSVMTSSNMTEMMSVDLSYYKHVVLFSDGLHSFYRIERDHTSRRTTSLSVEDVLSELIAFKGAQGSFVARRAKRFKKQFASQNWYHADDLAIGAIYLGN